MTTRSSSSRHSLASSRPTLFVCSVVSFDDICFQIVRCIPRICSPFPAGYFFSVERGEDERDRLPYSLLNGAMLLKVWSIPAQRPFKSSPSTRKARVLLCTGTQKTASVVILPCGSTAVRIDHRRVVFSLTFVLRCGYCYRWTSANATIATWNNRSHPYFLRGMRRDYNCSSP
jgi:hypothetical protein